MFFGENWLIERLLLLIPLILSLSVHEWAHAAAAKLLGDDTAEKLGRLTLNPVSHIDPIGSILLPMIGIPFGWAKPVPFNPTRFRRKYPMGFGTMLVAAAGPASNVVLAAIFLAGFWLLNVTTTAPLNFSSASVQLFYSMIFLNLMLAIFNLLPVPPLDGSHIANALMPKFLRPYWEAFSSLGTGGLALIIIIPLLLGFNLFLVPMQMIESLIRLVI